MLEKGSLDSKTVKNLRVHNIQGIKKYCLQDNIIVFL